MNVDLWIVGGLMVLGLILGYFFRRFVAFRQKTSLEREAQEQSETAKTKAKEIVLTAKDKAATILTEASKEERQRKQDIRRLEDRLLKREDSLDKQKDNIETQIQQQEKEREDLKNVREEIDVLREKSVKKLEEISSLTKEQAKKDLFEEMEKDFEKESEEVLARLLRDRRGKIEAKSLEIITSALQRYARDNIDNLTTSVVHLPSEDIKGKIIGREGRNIRTFERLTGVEVIIDETPESILLSSFDPLRREIAKIALEKLIKDGRIQPAKVEEKVEEARQELEDKIHKIGEEAVYEVGILDLPKEIIYLLGRLNYRTSYGQNVLVHSIEMAHIAGMMAAELGVRVDVAKKAALLHDIGKAIDHEVEGTHVELGRKILKKHGVDESVIKSMESHHEEYPYSTPESYIVATADIISTARPGARRDTLEKYLRRMKELEKTVNAFDGVKKAYAVSAGREVRVFIIPEKIDDFGTLRLAKSIAGKIQSDLQYPGEIKVTVIREVKAVEYAR